MILLPTLLMPCQQTLSPLHPRERKNRGGGGGEGGRGEEGIGEIFNSRVGGSSNSIYFKTRYIFSVFSYEEFIRNTDDLNSMDCYTHLVSRAQHVGYKISKVVYRGFAAAPPLQATHDNAVRTRMSLRLDAESEEQEQTIQKFQLTRENERTKLSEFGSNVYVHNNETTTFLIISE